MTYVELLTSLQAEGYQIVATGGMTETIEDHLTDGTDDPENVIYGDSETPDNPCLLIYVLPDQEHPVCQIYRAADYAHQLTVQGQDADAELRRLGLLITTTEAANLFGVHRDTTRRAAAGGQVDGAHLVTLPGILGQVWVATTTAWREWDTKRRPAGRPAR